MVLSPNTDSSQDAAPDALTMADSQLTDKSNVFRHSPALSEWPEGGDNYVITKVWETSTLLEVLQRNQASDQVV